MGALLRPSTASFDACGAASTAGFLALRIWLCATVALALSACTSTPQASPERDADAKLFASHPATAAVYVYRPDFTTSGATLGDPALWVDNRLIGATLPRTYFRIDLRPGGHQVRTDGAGKDRITITTASGEVYFVRLTVYDGPARFQLMDPEIAKREIVRCCALLENWAPGQRPLLR